MAGFSTLAGGATEAAVTTASSTGITVSDASTDTKGSWTELLASTAYPTDWIMVTASSLASADSFLFDIGVGASTAEKVLIPDILHDEAGVLVAIARQWLWPIYIPAGTRLSARCQSSTSSTDSMSITVHLFASQLASIPGLSRVEGFGSVSSGSKGTAHDPGASINTKAASWTQLIASTSHPYRWMTLSTQVPGASLAAATEWLFDIGVGAAAAEKVVVPNLWQIGPGTTDAVLPACWSFPVNIPAGSRVSVRAQCSVNTATERNLVICGQGVG